MRHGGNEGNPRFRGFSRDYRLDLDWSLPGVSVCPEFRENTSVIAAAVLLLL